MKAPHSHRTLPAGLPVLALAVAASGCLFGPGESTREVSQVSHGYDPGLGYGYTVTFTSDGNAADARMADRAPTVECVGRFLPERYRHLEAVLDREGFFGMSDDPPKPYWHTDSFVCSTRHGEEKCVRYHKRRETPGGIATIEDAVLEVTRGVAWSARPGHPEDQAVCARPVYR